MKRQGDYEVKLTKDVNCYYCGCVIKKGSKSIKMYANNTSYECLHFCEGKEELEKTLKN